MEIIDRVNSFLQLKKTLETINNGELDPIINEAKIKNPWFTDKNVRLAFQGIIGLLHEENLRKWITKYNFRDITSKKIGVVMAGNVPMVGFHDLLCVLLSNHHLKAKLSSQDDVLLPYLVDKLIEMEPTWEEKIEFVEKVKQVDVVIATGSDNTSRYFEYYFRNIQKIIRKNRTSIAILNGNETKEELRNLGKDIYQYFGLGCRNVSKILIPEGYDIKLFLDELNDWIFLTENHKYMNNYTYNRAIYSMEKIPYLDNGFTLFTKNQNLVSPTAVIYYDHYLDNEIKEYIHQNESKIQCIVSGGEIDGLKTVRFGEAQMPEIWDYADNIDTMEFLLNLGA